MGQRGRPRHPDLLTPREWEVLLLVREGLSNREIGDRLGVSRDGIKYHISQILPKLGVSTREEAAAWQPPVPATAPQTTGLASRFSRITRVGLIGTAGALLAGLVALGGAVAYNELSGGSNDASVDALGGPPTASPDPIPTVDFTPAPAPLTDGSLGSVAYVKNGNLWELNLDTGDDRMLVDAEAAITFETTAGKLTVYQPEWSADGQWISLNIIDGANIDTFRSAFLIRTSDRLLEYGGGNVGRDWSPTDLVVYADGGLSRPVGFFPDDVYPGADSQFVTNVGYGEAKWSPDGTRVAVSEALVTYNGQSGERRISPPYRVSIVDPTSAQPTIAPNDTPAGVTRLYESDSGARSLVIHSWSPDGKYILFSTGTADDITGELALISVDDPSSVETVGNTPVMQSGAAWSPDGSLLAVGQVSGPLRIWRPGEGFQYNLGGDGALDPSWSPDGSRIVFSKLGRITTAAADASDEQQLTNDDANEDRYPQYSQDGSRILFVRLNAESIANGVASTAELWLMNSDGSDAHKVADLLSVDGSIGGKAHHVDWTKYLSWYQPTGVGPLATAAPPSPGPTFAGPTPPLPPGVKTLAPLPSPD